MLKYLTKFLLITSLLLLLGGCNIFERQEYEKRISRVSEVYPTEKVSDLFDKFPGGFNIQHIKTEKNTNDEIIDHTIFLIGNPDDKSITGTYTKINRTWDKKEASISVQYNDIKGIHTTEDYQFDPIVQNVVFLFQKLDLNSEELQKMKFLNVSSNPVTNAFGIRYHITNHQLNNYLKLSPDEELEIKFFGNKFEDESEQYYTNFWIKKESTTYLDETVIGFE